MGTEKKARVTWTLRPRWYLPIGVLALTLALPGLGRVTGREPGVPWVHVQLPDAPAPLDDPHRPSPGVHVSVVALDDCWVELEADGKPMFAKLLREGQSHSVEGSDRVRLVSGNAAAVSIVFNGQAIEKPGLRGRRILDFSSKGFELLRDRR